MRYGIMNFLTLRTMKSALDIRMRTRKQTNQQKKTGETNVMQTIFKMWRLLDAEIELLFVTCFCVDDDFFFLCRHYKTKQNRNKVSFDAFWFLFNILFSFVLLMEDNETELNTEQRWKCFANIFCSLFHWALSTLPFPCASFLLPLSGCSLSCEPIK